jgi:hypothetical protein
MVKINVLKNTLGVNNKIKQLIWTHVDSKGEAIPLEFSHKEIMKMVPEQVKNNKTYMIDVLLDGKWYSGKSFTKEQLDDNEHMTGYIFAHNQWYDDNFDVEGTITAFTLYSWRTK